MSTSPVKRSGSRRTRPAAFVGVALAATALTAAITPPAAPVQSKLEVALAATAVPEPLFTVGPLGGLITPLINALGQNPFPLPVGGIAYNFSGGAPTTQGIYNLINELAYKPRPTDINTCQRATQAQCRTAFMLSTGYGALGTTSAIQGLIGQAQGKTTGNLDPLKPATGTGMTQVSPIYINNILRPNGGFDARFPMLVEPFGVSATMPATGEFGPNKDGSSVYNWITDFTWPYNTLADFPIAPNPIAIANSIYAAIPPLPLVNTIISAISGGGDPLAALIPVLNEAAGTLSGPAVGGTVSLPSKKQCAGACDGWADLGTLLLFDPLTGNLPGQALDQYVVLGATKPFIPLTAPNYLAALAVNTVLKQIKSPYLLGTPVADVLTPALKILVNIAYNDVVTPAKLNTVNPDRGAGGKTFAQQNYTAYDRTFATPVLDKPTPFSWSGNPAMSKAEMDAVPGDVGTALTDAFKAQAAKPYFGIIVPNPDVPPAPPAAKVAAAAAAAVEAPVVEAPPAVVDSPPAVGAADNGGSTGHSARGAKSGNNDNAGGGSRGHRGSHD